jgi:hypothetical protein
MKIIGIGHRKGVGKDTFAGYLAEDLARKGYLPCVCSFADPLKSYAKSLFKSYGLKDGNYYDTHRDEKEANLPCLDKSPRDIYIELGLSMRRLDENFWIRKALVERPHVDYLIVPDVRFPNEANVIRDSGGHLVKVINPDVPDTDDEADCALKDYRDWKTTIVNDGNLDDLDELAQCVANMV